MKRTVRRNRIRMVLLLAISSAQAAWATCEITAEQIPTLEGPALADALFGRGGCEALAEPIAKRLEQMHRDGVWPTERDGAWGPHALERASVTLLRSALLRGDISDARQRLDSIRKAADQRYDEQMEKLREVLGSSENFDEEEAASVLRGRERTDHWQAIAAVLDGAEVPVHGRIDAPASEWTLSFGWCGTPYVTFMSGARQPGAADAWVARGRPEVALQVLLAAQWVDAVGLGGAPPRLREFAELAFGPGSYEREVQAALAAIRIDDQPGRRQATMPLFGLQVPLPVAIKSWQEEPRTFVDAADIANYMRDQLLPREELAAE